MRSFYGVDFFSLRKRPAEKQSMKTKILVLLDGKLEYLIFSNVQNAVKLSPQEKKMITNRLKYKMKDIKRKKSE